MIIIYMSLIIFHELGHFLTALLFNWKFDKIYIYPLGGVTLFKDRVNKPFIEELLVTIMGPIFQIILTIILVNIYEDIIIYSNTLLVFNLLPITPLDGGRLTEIIMSCFLPFKKSMNYIIKISFIIWILIFTLILKTNSLVIIISFLFLIFKIIDENKKISYYYNKFIIERVLHIYKGKNKIIKDINDLYKYKNNYIIIDNHLYSEKEYIERFLM